MNYFLKRKKKNVSCCSTRVRVWDYLHAAHADITRHAYSTELQCRTTRNRVFCGLDQCFNANASPKNNMVLISQYEFPGIWEKVIVS